MRWLHLVILPLCVLMGHSALLHSQEKKQPVPNTGVTEILGKADDFGVDVEILIRSHHIPHEFPEDVLEQARSMTIFATLDSVTRALEATCAGAGVTSAREEANPRQPLPTTATATTTVRATP